jgi:nitroimidazol reductase NimA-like FMN-containing flavoprotein (pyridoxamine 5'-phosphate oxidase superfamily)
MQPNSDIASDQHQTDAFGLQRLDDEECWRVLQRYSIGRVGIVHLGAPMIFPVNYAVEGRSVVFRTAPGTKLAMAAIGRQAVFEVDDAFDVLETGTSVMVHGTLEEVREPEERDRILGLPLRCWAPGDRDHVVRVRTSYVSGRRIVPHDFVDGVTADGG